MYGQQRCTRTTTAEDGDMALALALAETEKERGSEAEVQRSPHSTDGATLHSDSYTGQLYEHTGCLLRV